MNIKPTFLLSFIARYWPMIIVAVLFTVASHYDQITYFVGPTFYLLLLLLICAVGTLLLMHMIFRRTIDAYTQKKDSEGKYVFVNDFWAMPAGQRVWMTMVVLISIFLGACLIASSLAK